MILLNLKRTIGGIYKMLTLQELREAITPDPKQIKIKALNTVRLRLEAQVTSLHKNLANLRSKPFPDPVAKAKIQNQIKGLQTKIDQITGQIQTVRET